MGLGNVLNQIFRPVLEAIPENNRLERIWLLAKIEFKKRYYEQGAGLLWALINPLFRLAIYSFVFTQIVRRSEEHFHLYLFSVLILWLFFNEGTRKGLSVLKTKMYLIENIKFNKFDLFFSICIASLMGFFFNLLAYLIMHVVTGVPFTVHALWAPLFVVNLFILIYAICLLLATINIYLKDIVHLWDVVTLAGFWVTPIFVGRQVLESFPILLWLNPLAGLFINFRDTLLYGLKPDFLMMMYSFGFAFLLLGIGIWAFNRFSDKAFENK